MPEQYTLGYDSVALAFVSRRRLDIDGAALLPLLRPGMSVVVNVNTKTHAATGAPIRTSAQSSSAQVN